MAMGRRKDQEQQEELWVPRDALAKSAGHPFYQRLNQLLEASGFDDFVEERCQRFYKEGKRGRPTSVVTSKPANGDQGKTGQRRWPRDLALLLCQGRFGQAI
jgi:hypothetical protein